MPSIIAASMIGFGTPCSAAMKMIMKKPVFFQTSMMMIEVIAMLASVSQRTAGRPTSAEEVVDDAEIVAEEIAPDDRDEGRRDDHRQEEGEPEEVEQPARHRAVERQREEQADRDVEGHREEGEAQRVPEDLQRAAVGEEPGEVVEARPSASPIIGS